MLFKIEWLKQIFTSYRGKIDAFSEINHVNTDSRESLENALFIPIVGERFNGHAFVEQAIDNGAVAIIWDKKENLPASIPTDFPVFFTEDTTEGLHKLAKAYRHLINPIVVGITGSNGKTTTKDLVAAIGKSLYQTHYTLGNFNNLIGLPLTILSMPRDTELLVLEMGMDRFGEIDMLTSIASPDYAIITNIGESHIEFLGSREGIAKAKLEIINGLKPSGTLIIDGDEPLLKQLYTDRDIIVNTVGFTATNDYQLMNANVTVEGTSFTIKDGATYQIPLIGKHHTRNAGFAICLAEHLQIPVTKQKTALLELEHTPMRFERLQAKNGATVVNDAYNASPTSMQGAIEIMKHIAGFSTRILVLGDVLELGSFSEEMHRQLANAITEPITHLYTYGENAAYITDEINKTSKLLNYKHYHSKEQLINDLQASLNENTIVLFKASRGMQFETMINAIIIDKK